MFTTRGRALLDLLNHITFVLDIMPSKALHLVENEERRYIIGINHYQIVAKPMQNIIGASINAYCILTPIAIIAIRCSK